MDHSLDAPPLERGEELRGQLTLGLFDARRIRLLERVGVATLRYGLVALLVLWGGLKFTDLEAQAIRPLVEHHPLLGLLYPAFGIRGTSALIGVVELSAATLICLRRFRPRLSALGSLLSVATFSITLSFLITTPHVLAPDNPFGGFLMKDLILLGAALYTAAEALAADRASSALPTRAFASQL